MKVIQKITTVCQHKNCRNGKKIKTELELSGGQQMFSREHLSHANNSGMKEILLFCKKTSFRKIN